MADSPCREWNRMAHLPCQIMSRWERIGKYVNGPSMTGALLLKTATPGNCVTVARVPMPLFIVHVIVHGHDTRSGRYRHPACQPGSIPEQGGRGRGQIPQRKATTQNGITHANNRTERHTGQKDIGHAALQHVCFTVHWFIFLSILPSEPEYKIRLVIRSAGATGFIK